MFFGSGQKQEALRQEVLALREESATLRSDMETLRQREDSAASSRDGLTTQLALHEGLGGYIGHFVDSLKECQGSLAALAQAMKHETEAVAHSCDTVGDNPERQSERERPFLKATMTLEIIAIKSATVSRRLPNSIHE